MRIEPSALLELKQIYKKNYNILLTDEQALDLGTRLIELFKVISKPIPLVDKAEEKRKIKYDGR